MLISQNVFARKELAEFEQAVSKLTKGKSLCDLTHEITKGLHIEAYYENGAPHFLATDKTSTTQIAQRIDHPDEQAALAAIEQAHGLDVEIIDLLINDYHAALGAGLPNDEVILQNIVAATQKDKKKQVQVRIWAGESAEKISKWLGADVQLMKNHSADGRWVANAFGSSVTELAVCANSFLALLKENTNASESPIQAVITTSPKILESIAKLRALRLLTTRLCEIAERKPTLAIIHAETCYSSLSARDVPSNILRGTYAAMAAFFGGADSVNILPYTRTLGVGHSDAERLAITGLHVLRAEGHMARVGDPLAGAGAIEQLSQDLAAAAWQAMQQIEAAGGIRTPQGIEVIEAMLSQDQNNVKATPPKVIGVNLHTLETDQPPTVSWPLTKQTMKGVFHPRYFDQCGAE